MQLLFIQLLFIVGVYCAPPDFLLDGSNDKLNPVGESSSLLNSEVQPNESSEEPKYSCSILDEVLVNKCKTEAQDYLDDSRKTCCLDIVSNNCKVRLLKQVCSEEDYTKKLEIIESNIKFLWEERPECPKNYGQSYCDVGTIEALTGLPSNWVYIGVIVFLIIIFLLAIIFGIKYC